MSDVAVPNTELPGTQVAALEPLESFDPNAILYVVVNGQDFHIRLDKIVELIAAGVDEVILPDDLVTTEFLQQYVTQAIEELQTNPGSGAGGDLTASQLENMLGESESFQRYVESVRTLKLAVDNLHNADPATLVKKGTTAQTGRVIGMDDEGVVENLVLGSTKVVYVCKRNNPKYKNGSLSAPFVTIQEAIDSVGTSVSNMIVMLLPAETGDYEGFTINGRVNVTVFGQGVTDAHMLRIVGPIVNEGAAATRFRLKDVQLKQNDAAIPAYHNKGTLGRDYFKNVTVEQASASQVTPVVKFENTKNWHDFEDCNINGFFDVEGEAGPGALIAFRSCNALGTKIRLNSNVKILLNFNTRFGYIIQNQGSVEINYTHTFAGNNGVAVESNGGDLALNFVNLIGPDGVDQKVVRQDGLPPASYNNVSVRDPGSLVGPKVDLIKEQIEDMIRPIFTISYGGTTDGLRQVTVKRVATKGYYYSTLQAKLVQTLVGGNPLAENVTHTSFDIEYAEPNTDTSVPVTSGLPEMHLVVSDPNNEGKTFVFGPFGN